MEDIINDLIKIEKTAAEVVSKAVSDKENMHYTIHQRTEEIKHRIEANTAGRIKELYAAAQEESTKRVAEVKAHMETTLAQLQTDFVTNKEKWEDEIFSRIIG